ncbi:MAG: hypothetical protein WB624_19600 [Xanthobacteraceae bacterium]
MRIANQCQQRALLLLQIAQECPQFREQAIFIAREWLNIAALRIDCLNLIGSLEKETGTN